MIMVVVTWNTLNNIFMHILKYLISILIIKIDKESLYNNMDNIRPKANHIFTSLIALYHDNNLHN